MSMSMYMLLCHESGAKLLGHGGPLESMSAVFRTPFHRSVVRSLVLFTTPHSLY